jgi:hypothetical protein
MEMVIEKHGWPNMESYYCARKRLARDLPFAAIVKLP